MVTNITSLTGNGLKDWLIQRVSAVFFAGYALFFIGFILCSPELTYSQWHALFHQVWFQIASVVALFMLTLHSWIGLWTVTTDYINCTAIRLSLQMIVMFGLLSQLCWGLLIVWGQ